MPFESNYLLGTLFYLMQNNYVENGAGPVKNLETFHYKLKYYILDCQKVFKMTKILLIGFGKS